jgi:predicted protein tyrosine phosphatase
MVTAVFRSHFSTNSNICPMKESMHLLCLCWFVVSVASAVSPEAAPVAIAPKADEEKESQSLNIAARVHGYFATNF